MYDFLIVGCGLFGATFAQQAIANGKKVLIVDVREHIAGNCYTERKHNIDVHKYGPHIFHTSNKAIWEYVQRFSEFNSYQHHGRARVGDTVYSFPINLMTLQSVYGVKTPDEAEALFAEFHKSASNLDITNLEGWAISQIGEKLYEMFVKGYTQKQWGRDPKELPASIIRRIPVRMTYDDRYFNDAYNGIPVDGYTGMVRNMIEGADVVLGFDYLKDRNKYSAHHIIFTGPIDAYYEYKFGKLEYRTLRFEEETHKTQFYQGASIINYNDASVPYTRITEHKMFTLERGSDHTIITKEYPDEWTHGKEPFYPIACIRNKTMLQWYQGLANSESNVTFGGRLGTYQYYDMHQVIAQALTTSKKFFNK